MVHETNFNVRSAKQHMALWPIWISIQPVMVSVVSSNPTGGDFLKFFKPLDVNFCLKCKCDLIVKNSIVFWYSHVGLKIL